MEHRESEAEAWAFLVLSLGQFYLSYHPYRGVLIFIDGGGIRGLSSLYILRDVMRRVKRIDETKPPDKRLEPELHGSTKLPLPCNYFDFIVGTSTGG